MRNSYHNYMWHHAAREVNLHASKQLWDAVDEHWDRELEIKYFSPLARAKVYIGETSLPEYRWVFRYTMEAARR